VTLRYYPAGTSEYLHYFTTALMGTRKHLAEKHPEAAIPEVSEPLTQDDKLNLAIAHVEAHHGIVFDDKVA
jgi:hypothetical protein